MVQFDSSSNVSKPQSKFSLGCLVVFLIPFFAVGIGTFSWGMWGVYQGVASKSWTKVAGVITHSEVEAHSGSKGTTYGAKIQYTYTWEGKPLAGDQVQTCGPVSSSDGNSARADVAKYGVGKKVEVFVNPANPKKAVLETGLGWSHLFLPVFGLFFGGMASVFLWLAVWNKRKQEAAKAAKGFGVIDFEGKQEGPDGVDWTPLKYVSATFRTNKLRQDQNGNIRVVPTFGMWAFAGIFGLFGLGACVGIWVIGGKEGMPLVPKIMGCVVGLIFVLVSAFLIRSITRGPIFDVQDQTCNRLNAGTKDFGGERVDVPFAQAMGLQVMAWSASGVGPNGGYQVNSNITNYQLNLVLKDKTRWKVMSSSNFSSLESDAQTLSQLLRVPLWKRL